MKHIGLSRLLWVLALFLFLTPLYAGGRQEAPGSENRPGASENPADGAETVSVFVSVLPQTYFVERIGGDTVRVTALVPPGRGPATYEPTPRQVSALGAADLYFTVGVPFEASFLPRIEESLPDLRIVDSARDVEKRYLDAHDHEEDEHDEGGHDEEGHDEDDHGDDDHDEDDHAEEHEADHDDDDHDHAGAPDPHVWLGPEEVLRQIAVIRDTLIDLNPEFAGLYRENYTRFAEEIRALQSELAAELAPLEGETFYVYHPSFGYFGDAFGLEQVAIETGGDEPTPAQLRRIITAAREDEVRVIFVQPQFSQSAAQRVAEAIDGAVVSVNHLNPDWFEMMRTISETLREGLE